MEAAYRSPAGPFKLPRRGHFFAAQSAKKRRMLLSNWHSTAKSRVRGPSGGISLLAPSTQATIVVRPVAEASLLPISIVVLGKARCMMSAHRSARPTSWGIPQATRTEPRTAYVIRAAPCPKHGILLAVTRDCDP